MERARSGRERLESDRTTGGARQSMNHTPYVKDTSANWPPNSHISATRPACMRTMHVPSSSSRLNGHASFAPNDTPHHPERPPDRDHFPEAHAVLHLQATAGIGGTHGGAQRCRIACSRPSRTSSRLPRLRNTKLSANKVCCAAPRPPLQTALSARFAMPNVILRDHGLPPSWVREPDELSARRARCSNG